MSEENKNTITYDENWQSVTESEYPQISEPENEEENDDIRLNKKSKPPKDSPKQYLITIQLVACIIIALVAFLLKSFGGEIYTVAHDWYYSQLNDSAIFEDNQNYDLNEIFGISTQDEV